MTGNDTQQRLAAFIGRETEYWDFWGAIRIVKDGKILWETSRGYSCAEFGVKNTLATRFTIASVTKQFTAFAIMLLYDRRLFIIGCGCKYISPGEYADSCRDYSPSSACPYLRTV